MDEKKSVCFLALGDSLTEGLGADHPNRHWVSQLFNYLKWSDQCCLYNFGISGTQSSELWELTQNSAVIRMITRATHLSISTGGCDFIDLWEKNLISWTNLIQTIQRVNQNARKILSFLRSQNPQADMYVLGFYLPLPAYQFGVKRVKWMVKRLNRCYQAICKENRAYFLDPFDLFFEKRELFADEVHPNQKGYNVIAEHFINHLGAQSRHSSIGVQANPPFSS